MHVAADVVVTVVHEPFLQQPETRTPQGIRGPVIENGALQPAAQGGGKGDVHIHVRPHEDGGHARTNRSGMRHEAHWLEHVAGRGVKDAGTGQFPGQVGRPHMPVVQPEAPGAPAGVERRDDANAVVQPKRHQCHVRLVRGVDRN